MNDEYNPYDRPLTERQDQTNNAPRPEERRQTNQYYPQQNQPPYTSQYYYPYPQYAQPKGSVVAKVFSIISFVLGCFSLLIALFFAFAMFVSRGSAYYSGGFGLVSLSNSVTTALPGLVFGIIALAKGSRLFALALLGVIFNSMLVLLCVCTFLMSVLAG